MLANTIGGEGGVVVKSGKRLAGTVAEPGGTNCGSTSPGIGGGGAGGASAGPGPGVAGAGAGGGGGGRRDRRADRRADGDRDGGGVWRDRGKYRHALRVADQRRRNDRRAGNVDRRRRRGRAAAPEHGLGEAGDRRRDRGGLDWRRAGAHTEYACVMVAQPLPVMTTFCPSARTSPDEAAGTRVELGAGT